jgi:hypothetical protein
MIYIYIISYVYPWTSVCLVQTNVFASFASSISHFCSLQTPWLVGVMPFFWLGPVGHSCIIYNTYIYIYIHTYIYTYTYIVYIHIYIEHIYIYYTYTHMHRYRLTTPYPLLNHLILEALPSREIWKVELLMLKIWKILRAQVGISGN